MRSRLLTIVSRLCFIGLTTLMFTGASCSSPSVSTGTVSGSSTGAVASTEQTSLVSLINQERAKRGLNALNSDGTLQSVATQYSSELAGTNSGSYNFAVNGTDMATRLRVNNVVYNNAGHVGALDFTTGATLVNSLIAANSFLLTDSSFNSIGVGVSKSASHNYWTIVVTN